MKRPAVCLIVFVSAVTVSGCAVTPRVRPQAEVAEESAYQRGRKATHDFYAGQTTQLYERFSDEMRAALPPDTWKEVQASVTKDLGPELSVREERWARFLDSDFYRREVVYSGARDVPLVVTWAFRPDGTITSFSITKPVQPYPSQFVDYRTRTPLRLPVREQWVVL